MDMMTAVELRHRLSTVTMKRNEDPKEMFKTIANIKARYVKPGHAIPCKKSDMDVYLPCKFLGHRQSTKAKANRDEKEEFKMEFDNEQLATKGLKKQWRRKIRSKLKLAC